MEKAEAQTELTSPSTKSKLPRTLLPSGLPRRPNRAQATMVLPLARPRQSTSAQRTRVMPPPPLPRRKTAMRRSRCRRYRLDRSRRRESRFRVLPCAGMQWAEGCWQSCLGALLCYCRKKKTDLSFGGTFKSRNFFFFFLLAFFLWASCERLVSERSGRGGGGDQGVMDGPDVNAN